MNNPILSAKEVLDLKDYYAQWGDLPKWAMDKILLMALFYASQDTQQET